MKFDEFIRRVESEPPRVVRMRVSLVSPAEVSGGKPIMLEDFIAVARLKTELRDLRFGHILGAGASLETITAWEQEFRVSLPEDLKNLLARVNGIHLWARESGRAYHGIAPIEEWDLARVTMYGADSHPLLSDQHVALSYHSDSAAFAVLDVRSGTYFLMDCAGADEKSAIGKSVDELLDWCWEGRIPPSDKSIFDSVAPTE